MSRPEILVRADGTRIAYHTLPGIAPTVVFLPGFASDMTGGKALHLEAWCRDRGRAYLRLDYRGHGASSGRFEDGTVGDWAGDACAVIEAATTGPLVLVGSSMGGWIMLLVALTMPERIAGLVGIAPAPDFTEDLAWNGLDPAARAALAQHGIVHVPSRYAEAPCPITMQLIEDGRTRLLLRSAIRLDCPVRLVHGLDDPDVPWETSLRLARALTSPDVRVTLVKGAGHRLSAPAELALITEMVEEVIGE